MFARGLLLVAATGVAMLVFLAPGRTPVEGGAGDTAREPYSRDLFIELARSLERYYLDPDRLENPRRLLRKAFRALETAADEIYVEDSDESSPYIRVYIGGKVQVFSLATVDRLRDATFTLDSLFSFIQANYDGDLSVRDIQYAVLNGFLSGLDPHTIVFSPKEFEDFSVHIEGEIFGVGMYVGGRDGKLKVIEVLEGTPAERAGFRSQDVISKIGDESTINMTVNEAVGKIRGPRKSTVTLTVKRKSKADPKKLDTLAIDVERDKVVIKSVKSKLIDDWDGPGFGGKDAAVGYVSVSSFDKNTTPTLRSSLRELREANGGKPLSGLILDLRGNSGGLLTQAVEMCDLFLESGDIVVQASRGNISDRQRARDSGQEPKYPIVLLGDRGSASGAEIVIGALQKNDRAVVIGTRTFGKGSVQQLHGLRSIAPQIAQLKITVSEYLIPGDISIQGNGVIPDILAYPVMLVEGMTGEGGGDVPLDLFPDDDSMTESDYDQHIVSRFAKEEKPSYELKYLVEPEEFDDESLLARKLQPTKDKLVEVSLRLLAIMKDEPSRRNLLRNRHAEVGALETELFEEIATRLTDLGIDWAKGPAVESPETALSLSLERLEEPSDDPEDPVPVNRLLVSARVENKGDKTLYRVKGVSASEYYLLRDHEFLFGKIEPGQSVERQVRITLPYFPLWRDDVLTVRVSGQGGEVFETADLPVLLEGVERPRFSYAATLADADSGEELTSLEPGRKARLRLTVRNVGKAAAHKGVIILRNATGRQVFLTRGRIEFTDLAPGAETEADFEFEVRRGEPVSAYEFELGIVDSYSGSTLSTSLEVPRTGKEVQPLVNGHRFEAPIVQAKLRGPPSLDAAERESTAESGVRVTDSEMLTIEGRIASSDGTPFQYWVMRTEIGNHTEFPDKIFFDDSKGAPEIALRVPVTLTEGSNLFTVVAHDQNGLETRANLIVRRTKPTAKLEKEKVSRGGGGGGAEGD